jgi:hypothetical protein
MIKAPRISLPLLAVLSVVTLASPAGADETGKAGRISMVRVNTPGSAEHASYHGSVRVKMNNGKTEDYLWGGSTCPAQKLGEAQIDLLLSGLTDRHRMQLVPYFVPGEASKKCLVAFELTAG